jgi:hypothetical protein
VRRLTISRRLATLEALADTTYHEIAHIANNVISNQRGHGYTWQQHARKVGGCNAQSKCAVPDAVEMRPGEYLLCCGTDGCGKTYHYTKRSKNVERAIAGNLKGKCRQCNRVSTFTAKQVGRL